MNNTGRFGKKKYTPEEIYEMNASQMGESFWDRDCFDKTEETSKAEELKENKEVKENPNKEAKENPKILKEQEEKSETAIIDSGAKIERKMPRKIRVANSPLLPWKEEWMLEDKQRQ